MITYLVPRTLLYMPVVAATTATAGWFMAGWLGFMALANPERVWIDAGAGGDDVPRSQGLGVILPNNIRIYRRLMRAQPDTDRVLRLNRTNLRLSGIQGVLQVVIILIVAHLVVG